MSKKLSGLSIQIVARLFVVCVLVMGAILFSPVISNLVFNDGNPGNPSHELSAMFAIAAFVAAVISYRQVQGFKSVYESGKSIELPVTVRYRPTGRSGQFVFQFKDDVHFPNGLKRIGSADAPGFAPIKEVQKIASVYLNAGGNPVIAEFDGIVFFLRRPVLGI